MKFVVATAILAGAALLAGCAGSGGGARVASGNSKASQQALDQILSLAGEWEGTGPDGNKGTITFAKSSAGSSVREIMLPGSNHEMTNMYHCDGGSLILTHYCAAGNQPRMRAVAPSAGAYPMTFDFRFDSVTNLGSKDEGYMGGMTLTIVDKNTIKESWTYYKDGKAVPEHAVEFLLKRKGA